MNTSKEQFGDPQKRKDAIKAASDVKAKYNIPAPLKAIRHHCLQCVCGSAPEVAICAIQRCPLYPYRFGRNPREDDLPCAIMDMKRKITGYEPYPGYSKEI